MRFDAKQLSPLVRESARSFLLALIEEISEDFEWVDIRHVAYVMATVEHETAYTFAPIEEYGRGRGHSYGQPAANGKTYYGRGFVQLTWLKNYAKAGRKLQVDLVNHPELALQTDIAYLILAEGMRQGWFTGKKLGDYISGERCDYVNARRIINGLDKANEIAQKAIKWEKSLRVALIEDEPIDRTQVTPPPIEEVAQPLTPPVVVHPTAAATVTEEKTTTPTETQSGFSLDGLDSQAQKIETVVTTITKRADTIKAFRIAMGYHGAGLLAMLAGFWEANKLVIWASAGVIVLFGILYFLRQWHLGVVRERK